MMMMMMAEIEEKIRDGHILGGVQEVISNLKSSDHHKMRRFGG